MMNWVYSTSDIAEVDQHYVVSNLGPERVSVLEQTFLSHQDGEVNDGVLCSQCFDRIIVAMSTVRHSLGHEHNLQRRHDNCVSGVALHYLEGELTLFQKVWQETS